MIYDEVESYHLMRKWAIVSNWYDLRCILKAGNDIRQAKKGYFQVVISDNIFNDKVMVCRYR